MGKTGGSGAALAVIAGAALLGLSPIAVRLSELGPQATSFWRFAFALPILALWALWDRPRPNLRQSGVLLGAGVLFGLDIAFWSAALFLTTVANATLLSNMTPVFAALFGWFLFRERLGGSTLGGGLTALAGAVLLALARAGSGQGPPVSEELGWLGDGFGLFSALWYAGYLVIVRAYGGKVGVGAIIAISTLGSMLLATAASAIMGESLIPETARGWLILIGLALIVQVGGQGLIAWGVTRLPITISTVLLWIQPLAAAGLSWALFGEKLGPLAFVGAALILGGVWVVQRARAKGG